MSRRCVLGILNTDLGKDISAEMLGWLQPAYDVTVVEVEPPNDVEYELPFLRKACEVSVKTGEPVLYLHTKGAAMPNAAQPIVRRLWQYEFTRNADRYFSGVAGEGPLVAAPIVGKRNPVCWFNGFVMNSQAAGRIGKVLSIHEDRYWFEQRMLAEAGVDTVGIYDDTAEDSGKAIVCLCNWLNDWSGPQWQD